jgi:hypothetical protein
MILKMLYVTRIDSDTILGVYATAQDAMDAAAGRISAGRRVEIIPAASAPGSDLDNLPVSGTVWIYTARGGATVTAFSTMEGADARRSALGGTVRGFEISGAAGAKAVHSGDLRKAAINPKAVNVAANKVVNELIKLAQKQPLRMWGR